jgi:hypothetical protein
MDIMSTGEQFEKEAQRLFESRDSREALIRLNLAAKQYRKENNNEKALECEFGYRFQSGLLGLYNATDSNGVQDALEHLTQARDLIAGSNDSQREDKLLLVDAIIIEAHGITRLWKEGGLEIPPEFEEAERKLKQVKDKLPEAANFAEVYQQDVLGEVHFMRAIGALERNDMPGYSLEMGKSRNAMNTIIGISKNEIATAYNTGLIEYREANAALLLSRGPLSDNDLPGASLYLSEAIKHATTSNQLFTKSAPYFPKAAQLVPVTKGLLENMGARVSFVEGRRNLYLGNPYRAKQFFNRCVDQSQSAINNLQTTGEYGKNSIKALYDLKDVAARECASFTVIARNSKGHITVSASKQFTFFFFVTLGTFVGLLRFGLLTLAPNLILFSSFDVGAVSAFGLNAIKLKDLILPAKP